MKLQNNAFVKSSATLISGSLFAQILAVLISPIYTRLYSEAQIGEYTLILTAVSMFGTIVCGKYDASIVSESKDENVCALIKLSFLLTIIFSFFVSIGYSLYYKFNYETLMPAKYVFIWVFILLLLSGIGYVLSAYNNRTKDYKLLSLITVRRELGRDISLISLGLLNIGTVGLLVSQVFSVSLGLIKQVKSLKNKFQEIFHSSFSLVKSVAIKHKNQFLYSVPATFANSFSYTSLNLFISGLFGLNMLAYYSMSFRMLGMPLTLVAGNFSKVFFEKASREYDLCGDFRKTFIQTSLMVGVISFFMVILLMIFAPVLFELFFGEGWYESGIYARYLAPMFGIRLVVSTLSPCMTICQQQKKDLLIQVLFSLVSIFAYVLCKTCNFNIKYFLIFISVSYSIIYFIYYIYMYNISKSKSIVK